MPKSSGFLIGQRSLLAAATCSIALQIPTLAQVPASVQPAEPIAPSPSRLPDSLEPIGESASPRQPIPAPARSAPSAQPVQPADAARDAQYLLGPGDQIDIAVYGYEEYSGAKVILPDGTITLPLLGSVPAAQRTPDQLAQELSRQLNAYLVEPVVTVNLSTLRPVVVNVAGEVQRPGPVQLRGLTSNAIGESTPGSTTQSRVDRATTISSALVEAGGVTQNADIRQVVVRRSQSGGDTTTTVNLWDTLMSDAAPQDLILQDGDTVFVPRAQPGEAIDRRLLARSSLSPSTIRVRVVGEVKEPGEVQVSPNSTLSSAVAVAGGPTDQAKMSQVVYVRLNDDGQIERQIVDLSNLTDDYQVQDGDVIVVPETRTSSVLDFVGRVLSPLNFLFNLLR